MQNSPFESLLDEGAQAADPPPAAQPPQSQPPQSSSPPLADTATNAAQPDLTPPQPPSKHRVKKDGAPAKTANLDTTIQIVNGGNLAATNAAATGCKPLNSGKTKTDAKICEQTDTGGESKHTGDGKVADNLTPVDPTAVLPANPIPTVAPNTAVAAAITVATAPDTTPQTAPVTFLQTAPIVVDHQATAAAATPKIKTADAVVPDDSGKPAADSKSSTKPTFVLATDDKPPLAAGDTDKQDKQVISKLPDAVAAPSHHTTDAGSQPAIATDAQSAAPKAITDAAQQTMLSAPAQDVSPTAANPATAQPAAQALAVPLAGVAIEIASKVLSGKNRFEIRLDPPELGRIEVHLDVDRDGHTTTSLIADRSDTLDLLRRDSSGLERALQDAGLKTSDNGLQFSLRDQTMGRDQNNTPTPGSAQIVVNDDALPGPELTSRNYPRLAGLGGGVDIRV